ncbi:beta-lactam-binding protein with PASTA domain [Saccharomonospora amisosensis]|uniref:Beta-lactam-binding protein with PASTA domain n=1 Tax=Saccharomonospora amisosensis TaxID=1128677 RepID=A0A7X5UQE4_9PSEU|nr:PASTA domain-containing protein [Saccharomonospora amisosensis]NIJ11833.1 beta-lactam-binding protein with PASTA domain [Saccharomonospora amisosensis]
MRGPRPVTEVPDVVGLGAEDACDIVRRAGLIPVGPDGAGAPASGVVTAQRPVGTAGAEEGAEVVLWTHPGRDASVGAVSPSPVESATPV